MRVKTGRIGAGLCAVALLLAQGCGAAEVIAEGISGNATGQSPSRGQTSLQTAPFDSAGAPTHVSPAPAPAPEQAPSQDTAPDFTSIAANFNPGLQRFIWVLPPGVHGEGPWGFTVQVRHKGEVKHESEMPLVAEKLQAGSRPEFPAGYEIIRLTDDGQWNERSAALDKVIMGIIEQYGRGDGEVEFNNQLHLTLEPAARKLYCDEGKVADIQLYMEESGKAELVSMMGGANETFSRFAIMQGCEN
jgi:hypothetical protein